MAEYFRDDKGQDVLLLIDNIFRFVQAGSEVSGLMGRMPSRVGYQPTLATELAGLEERITSTKRGAITSIQAVYVPADDFTDPAAAHIFSHLSASVVLSRKRASEGLYPAVDPLASASVMLTPSVVGQRHYDIARAVRRTLGRVRRVARHHSDAGARGAVLGGPGDSGARPAAGAVLDATFLHHRIVQRDEGQVGAHRRYAERLRDDP